ncbi:MAG: DUF2997 domain-containing protein [Planctomycetia bacterium]|nr:DUF2997 domain-containing protein [Planctomycetia bacterium]
MSTNEKRIEITVSPEGATSIKTLGFTGGSCRDATRDLERALGISSRETLLQQFYAEAQSSEWLHEGN